MEDRQLGLTGLRVTSIGLGLAALGRPAYITTGRDADLGARRDRDTMEQRAHEVLDAAYDAGLRYVDAARSYGLAEAFLASWLRARHVAPKAITIGSKWGYTYVGDWRTTCQSTRSRTIPCPRYAANSMRADRSLVTI